MKLNMHLRITIVQSFYECIFTAIVLALGFYHILCTNCDVSKVFFTYCTIYDDDDCYFFFWPPAQSLQAKVLQAKYMTPVMVTLLSWQKWLVAFPLCRATESHWNRSMVSLVSYVTELMRLSTSELLLLLLLLFYVFHYVLWLPTVIIKLRFICYIKNDWLTIWLIYCLRFSVSHVCNIFECLLHCNSGTARHS